MGSYTNNQNFYLIDPTELVNVESDLNYNLRRTDERVKALVEYQTTDVPSLATLPKDVGYKFHKRSTNSVFNYHTDISTGITTHYQDPNAAVDDWSTTGLVFESGYASLTEPYERISYSLVNGWCRWRGRLMLNAQASEFPVQVITRFMNIPISCQPLTSKYFFVHGGNTTTDFQAYRIFIAAAGSADTRWEYIRYGGPTSTSNAERYISFNDIWYPVGI